MVGRWTEGFETHTATNQLERKYAQVSGTVSVEAGRVFGNSCGPSSLVLVTPSLTLQNTWIVGFGLIVDSNSSQFDTDGNGIYLEKGSDEQVHIAIESNASAFKVILYRGSTVIDETGFDYPLAAWQYFEMKVTIDPTTGSYELRQAGVLQFSGSGVNTADEGSAGADVFALRYADNLSNSMRLDDIYVCDGSGSTANDFLGPSIVEAVEVEANGDNNDWINDNTGVSDSNNFDQVNDPAAGADDVTIGGTISSDTNGEYDLFEMTGLSQITGNIHFVQVGIQAAMAAAGSRVLRAKFKDSVDGEAEGSNFTVDSTSFEEFVTIFDENPASAAAWDVTDINSGQFGVEVVS